LPKQKKELILECIKKHSSRFSHEDNKIEVKVLQSADALGVVFDDEWQEHSKKIYSKEHILELLDKMLNKKINLLSARKIAEPKVKKLRANLEN
jgi:peptide methionine sulfoxide reductase MsrB